MSAISENKPGSRILGRLRIAAQAIADDREALKQHRQYLTDLDNMPFGRYPLWMIVQYQHVERDLVVEQLLNYKQENPDWFGTDLVAVFHMFCRPLLSHPKLKGFYAEEGKWVDYLAARVPEFAQYAK